MTDTHVYVEGKRINRCLFCNQLPEAPIHVVTALLDGIEADWDASEGRP